MMFDLILRVVVHMFLTIHIDHVVAFPGNPQSRFREDTIISLVPNPFTSAQLSFANPNKKLVELKECPWKARPWNKGYNIKP